MYHFDFTQFVKKDRAGCEYFDRKAIVNYLQSFDGITASESVEQGIRVFIQNFVIWHCRSGFAVAELRNGYYVGHQYFEYSPDGLRQAIEYCLNKGRKKYLEVGSRIISTGAIFVYKGPKNLVCENNGTEHFWYDEDNDVEYPVDYDESFHPYVMIDYESEKDE